LAAVKIFSINIALGLFHHTSIVHILWQIVLQGGIYFFLINWGFKKRLLIYWGFQTVYYLGLIGYFTFYHRIFNAFLDFKVIGDGLEILLQGVIPLSPIMFLLLLDLPILLLFIRLYKSPVKKAKKLSFGLLSLTLILFALVTLSPLDGGALSWSISKIIPRQEEMEGVSSEAIEEEPEMNIVEEDNSFKGYLPKITSNEPPNFLLIQFESLQSGLPEMLYKDEPVMPFLNKLVKESIYFPYCFAYHRKGGTSDCEIAIFDNIDPENKVLMRSTTYGHTESFVKQLKPWGYKMYGFHNYSEDFYNRADSYDRLGFDDFFDYYDMEMGPPKWGAKDGEMFDFISQINPPDHPFLSYVITITSHVGYSHVNSYYENSHFDDVQKGRDRNAMLCFNYSDAELEKFLDVVRNKYENLYVFIFGDHATPTVEFDNKLNPSLYSSDENVMEFVPLIIIPPKEKEWKPRAYPDVLVSFHDIGPTILELVGIDLNNLEDVPKMWGGSIVSKEVNSLPIPYDELRLERSSLLSEIKKVVPISFPQEGDQIKSDLSSSTSDADKGGSMFSLSSVSR